MKKIAPSLLAADFTNLAKEIYSVTEAGADWLHMDVMDGIFVPNISIGIPIVEAASRVSSIPLDVHLMIVQPEKYISDFVKAGAKFITIHVEASKQVRKCLEMIRDLGARSGISLRPNTPIEALEPYLDWVDIVLVMTVEPGFGGQTFREDQISKIQWLFDKRATQQYPYLIQVDGGINDQTAGFCYLADSLVSGTYIFKHADRRKAINTLRSIPTIALTDKK